MSLKEEYNDLIKIFLLGKIMGDVPIINDWDKSERFYRNLENQNHEIKEATEEIQTWLYDFLKDDMEEGSLIDHYLENKQVKEIIDKKLRPIALAEINKSAMKSINGIKENKIQRFDQYNSINEGIDLYKVDIDKLTNSTAGIDLFFKSVEEIGMSVRKTTTNGYQIEANGNHLDLLNHWRDTYGLEYNVEKVSNREHPKYGQWFYTIDIFRDPTKFTDISDWMKKINQ